MSREPGVGIAHRHVGDRRGEGDVAGQVAEIERRRRFRLDDRRLGAHGVDRLLRRADRQVRQPGVHDQQRVQRHRRDLRCRRGQQTRPIAPHHLIAVIATVGRVDAGTLREAAPDVVDALLVVAARVDDRQLAEVRAAGDDAGAVGDAQRRAVGDGAGGRAVRIGIEAADLLVQRDELVGRDRTCQQCVQAILNADVVAGLPGAQAAGNDAGRRAPDGGGEVGVAAARAVRIGHRVVDQRGGQQAVVARRADRRQRAGRLVDDQDRHVIARLVVVAERVVPRLAAELVEMAVDRGLLGIDLRLREAAHQRRPFRTRVEVDQQDAIPDLEAGGDRVRVVATRLDAVEQSGIDRRGGVLLDRAARAAVAERVRDLAVGVGDVLLHHHQRLGVQDAVRVVERIGEAVVDDHEAARQRRVVGPVLFRAELQPRLARRRAEGVDDLAVPLRLRRERRPRLAGVEQNRDVVDAAIYRSALHAHDVRHRQSGGRSGHGKIVRRAARGVRLEAVVGRRRGRRARIRQRARAACGRRPVEELVLGRDIALRVDREGRQAARVTRRRIARCRHRRRRRADPGRRLRAQQHRSADRMIGDGERSARPAAATAVRVREKFVLPHLQPGQHPAHGACRRIGAEGGRDVEAVEPQRYLVKRHGPWYAHLDQRVAAADVVRSVRKGQDFELTGCGDFCRCRDSCHDGDRNEQRRENEQELRHDASQVGGHFNRRSLMWSAARWGVKLSCFVPAPLSVQPTSRANAAGR